MGCSFFPSFLVDCQQPCVQFQKFITNMKKEYYNITETNQVKFTANL